MQPVSTTADNIHQVQDDDINIDGVTPTGSVNTDSISDISACDKYTSDADSVKLLGSSHRSYRIASKRCITIEPVVIFMSLYLSVIFSLTDQCVRARIADTLNYTHSKVDNDNCTEVNVSSSSYALEKHIQSEASLWLMYLNSCALVPAFFSTLILGSYSDQAGRKIAILLPTVGAMFRVTVFILVLWYNWPLPFLLIGCFIEGLSGGAATILAASFAYLADITTHQQRSMRIVILEGCLALGILISQVALGYLISLLGYVYPFLILLGVNMLNFLYTAFILPESVVQRHLNVKLCSLHHFTKPVKLLLTDNSSKRRWKLQLIFCIHVIASMVTLTHADIQVLYTLDFPFCWDSIHIGLFIALGLLLSIPVSIILTMLLQKSITDLGLMLLAVLCGITFEVLMAAAVNTTMLFIVVAVSAPLSLITAMVRSISSKLVETHEEGSLFACIGWLQLLAVFVGGTVFQLIYSKTVFILRGLVFLVMAGVFSVAALLILVFALLLYTERKKTIHAPNPPIETADTG